jgi:hypothetical protein
VRDHAALVLRTAFERRLADFCLPSFGRHLQEGGPERGCESHDCAGIVDILVDQLVVHAHAVPLARVLRHQGRLREGVVDIIENQRRFDDRIAVVDQRWHNAVRIDLQIRGLVLVPAKRHDVVLGFLSLLVQRDADLLGANRIDAMVEFQHAILPSYAACAID